MGMQQGVRPGMPMEQDSQMVKMLSASFHLLHNIQVPFRLDYIKEANTMNPDQTASKGAV